MLDSATHGNSDAIKAHMNTYGSKISDYKQKHPESFNREGKVSKAYTKDGMDWKEFENGYPNDKKTHKDVEFTTEYMVDMYEAANKDRRKRELKEKYFDEKSK